MLTENIIQAAKNKIKYLFYLSKIATQEDMGASNLMIFIYNFKAQWDRNEGKRLNILLVVHYAQCWQKIKCALRKGWTTVTIQT